MSLMGKAAVALWTTMEDRRAHDAWHSHEHLPERLNIDGFLRGRRCAALDPTAAQYFVMYEVADHEVMTSPGYLACLNSPSVWTARTMKSVENVSRTLCDVAITTGSGVGSEVLTVRLTPAPGKEQTLTEFIASALTEFASRPGFVGGHLLKRSESVRPETKERELRKRPDDKEDWVLVVEAYDAAGLNEAAAREVSAEALVDVGAVEWPRSDRFRLAHLLEGSEMRWRVG